MAIYKVKVIETLAKLIEIEADNRDEAFEKAEELWFNGDIPFDEDKDFIDHEIYVTNIKPN